MNAHPQLGPLERLLTRVPLDTPGAAAHYALCAGSYAAFLMAMHQHGLFPNSPWLRSLLRSMLSEFAHSSARAAPAGPDADPMPTLLDPEE